MDNREPVNYPPGIMTIKLRERFVAKNLTAKSRMTFRISLFILTGPFLFLAGCAHLPGTPSALREEARLKLEPVKEDPNTPPVVKCINAVKGISPFLSYTDASVACSGGSQPQTVVECIKAVEGIGARVSHTDAAIACSGGGTPAITVACVTAVNEIASFVSYTDAALACAGGNGAATAVPCMKSARGISPVWMSYKDAGFACSAKSAAGGLQLVPDRSNPSRPL